MRNRQLPKCRRKIEFSETQFYGRCLEAGNPQVGMVRSHTTPLIWLPDLVGSETTTGESNLLRFCGFKETRDPNVGAGDTEPSSREWKKCKRKRCEPPLSYGRSPGGPTRSLRWQAGVLRSTRRAREAAFSEGTTLPPMFAHKVGARAFSTESVHNYLFGHLSFCVVKHVTCGHDVASSEKPWCEQLHAMLANPERVCEAAFSGVMVHLKSLAPFVLCCKMSDWQTNNSSAASFRGTRRGAAAEILGCQSCFQEVQVNGHQQYWSLQLQGLRRSLPAESLQLFFLHTMCVVGLRTDTFHLPFQLATWCWGPEMPGVETG